MKETFARTHHWCVLLAATAVLSVLGGCASYQPRPLQDRSPLATDRDLLRIETAVRNSGPVGHHEINPADGLDLTEVGIIAVINNPDLKVQRARLKLAGAQVFSAGLLPDPRISAGLDKPTGDTTGLVNSGLLALDYDIIPLITRQSRIDAARHGQEKVRLDLLWQEWQVIQQARSLAVRLRLQGQRLALLQTMRSLYRERYQRSSQALKAGDITLDVNGTDLTALLDTLTQINQLDQTYNRTRHRFNLLLGVDPQVKLKISPLTRETELDPEIVSTRLAELPRVRPDLLALKAGYQSQEARVRAAILAQFPSLGIGINGARDTGDVVTIGLSVSLSLPLFTGNRGHIAIARTSREQLREEYQARLARTEVDVDRMLKLQDLLRQQQGDLRTYLPRLKTLVERARQAYRRGDIEALAFLNMESTWVNKRLEQIRLLQAAWENRIALEALLALPGYPDKPLSLPPEP